MTELDNYLLGLVNKEDGVGNSLYLYNIEKFIENLWKEILKTGKRINVRETFPKRLNLEPTHFYAIIKSKRGISIQSLYEILEMWKDFCDKNKNDLKLIWNKIFESDFSIASFSKPGKIKLPKLITPDLSYLVGCIVGDGCFDPHENHYRLKISEQNKEQLKRLKLLFINIFDVNVSLKNEGSGRTKSNFIILHSKPIFRFFRNVLGVKVGKVPEIMKNTSIKNKKAFIRGVFDTEGSVDKNYLRSRIRFFQKSEAFLQNIMKILKEIGIDVNGPYHHSKYPSQNFHYFSEWYSIEIRRKSEILKFIEDVGSFHVEKQPKMILLAEKIRNKYKYMCSN